MQIITVQLLSMKNENNISIGNLRALKAKTRVVSTIFDLNKLRISLNSKYNISKNIDNLILNIKEQTHWTVLFQITLTIYNLNLQIK